MVLGVLLVGFVDSATFFCVMQRWKRFEVAEEESVYASQCIVVPHW